MRHFPCNTASQMRERTEETFPATDLWDLCSTYPKTLTHFSTFAHLNSVFKQECHTLSMTNRNTTELFQNVPDLPYSCGINHFH